MHKATHAPSPRLCTAGKFGRQASRELSFQHGKLQFTTCSHRRRLARLISLCFSVINYDSSPVWGFGFFLSSKQETLTLGLCFVSDSPQGWKLVAVRNSLHVAATMFHSILESLLIQRAFWVVFFKSRMTLGVTRWDRPRWKQHACTPETPTRDLCVVFCQLHSEGTMLFYLLSQFDGCSLLVFPSKHSKPPSKRAHLRKHTHTYAQI